VVKCLPSKREAPVPKKKKKGWSVVQQITLSGLVRQAISIKRVITM
jgi:hypothetical protein